jgi:hypothetical protein
MQNDLKQDDVNNDDDLDWMDWKPSKELERETMEKHYRKVIEENKNTLVFDAGSGEKMTVRQFEKFYGTDEYSKELIQAANINALYSKETAGKIKGMYSRLMQPKAIPITKSKVEQKPPVQTKPQKGIQEQFIPVRLCFVEKVKNADCHHNPTALLMILLKHRTWQGKMDKHHTFTYWYKKKGLIVASRSIASLAEELGTSERTVRKYLRMLEENGDIETVKGEKFASQRENVYVLGKVDDNGNEVLKYTVQK